MNELLFAQVEEPAGSNVAFALPILLGAAGYLLAVSSPLRRKSVPAGVCLLAAAIWGWASLWQPGRPGQSVVEQALFVVFAGLMLLAGCGMQVEANPVYAALWFALVILSTCGMFLMQGAGFISAATIIVYAGAIVVTFLFVIMLARQTGSSIYDRRFRNPALSIGLGALLMAVLVYVFQQPPAGTRPGNVAAVVGEPVAAKVDTVSLLGRSLFVDHLWSVEIAGILLLVATFGTILISLQTREDAA